MARRELGFGEVGVELLFPVVEGSLVFVAVAVVAAFLLGDEGLAGDVGGLFLGVLDGMAGDAVDAGAGHGEGNVGDAAAAGCRGTFRGGRCAFVRGTYRRYRSRCRSGAEGSASSRAPPAIEGVFDLDVAAGAFDLVVGDVGSGGAYLGFAELGDLVGLVVAVPADLVGDVAGAADGVGVAVLAEDAAGDVVLVVELAGDELDGGFGWSVAAFAGADGLVVAAVLKAFEVAEEAGVGGDDDVAALDDSGSGRRRSGEFIPRRSMVR